jgi:hypothetical protein
VRRLLDIASYYFKVKICQCSVGLHAHIVVFWMSYLITTRCHNSDDDMKYLRENLKIWSRSDLYEHSCHWGLRLMIERKCRGQKEWQRKIHKTRDLTEKTENKLWICVNVMIATLCENIAKWRICMTSQHQAQILQIMCFPTDTLNKQLRTADKGWLVSQPDGWARG